MDNHQNIEINNPHPPKLATTEKIKLKPKFIFGYVALVILLIAVAGVYVWQHEKVTDTNSRLSSSKTQTINLQKQVSSLQTALNQDKSILASVNSSSGDISYLNIPQWGIKVRLTVADASLITYKYSSTGGDDISGPGVGFVSLELNSLVTTDSSCQDLGIGISRHLVSSYIKYPGGSPTPTNVVGNYYYAVGGSPYSCGNSLLDDIRANYVGDNPTTWVYLSNN